MNSASNILEGLIIILLCLNTFYVLSVEADDSFPCGFTRCNRRGYDFCVRKPRIGADESPYCLSCESQRSLCWTDKHITECYLDCKDDLNRTTRQQIMMQLKETSDQCPADSVCMKKLVFNIVITVAPCVFTVWCSLVAFIVYIKHEGLQNVLRRWNWRHAVDSQDSEEAIGMDTPLNIEDNESMLTSSGDSGDDRSSPSADETREDYSTNRRESNNESSTSRKSFDGESTTNKSWNEDVCRKMNINPTNQSQSPEVVPG